MIGMASAHLTNWLSEAKHSGEKLQTHSRLAVFHVSSIYTTEVLGVELIYKVSGSKYFALY